MLFTRSNSPLIKILSNITDDTLIHSLWTRISQICSQKPTLKKIRHIFITQFLFTASEVANLFAKFAIHSLFWAHCYVFTALEILCDLYKNKAFSISSNFIPLWRQIFSEQLRPSLFNTRQCFSEKKKFQSEHRLF